MANVNPYEYETEPLLSASQGTASSCHSSCHEQNPSKGFTLRRCLIIPVFVFYFLAGASNMFEVPQYTQKIMKEKYKVKLPTVSKKTRLEAVYSGFAPSTPFVPIIPIVIDTDTCKAVNDSDPSYAEFTKVQQETALWTIYFAIAFLVPAMFSSLVWPSYSDVFGRRFPFVICLLGINIRLIVFSLVVWFDWSLIYIIVGNFVDGILGSFTTFLALSFSYLSDITDSGKQRTIAIVVFELLLGLTMTVSSFAVGYFIEYTGFLYPALVSSGLVIVALLIFILFVPETMRHQPVQRQSRNIFKTIGNSVKFYFCEGSKLQRIKYILLILGFLFNGIPSMNRGSLEVLYQLGRPFCWSSRKIGWFSAAKMAVCSLFGIGGTYLFKRCMADDAIATWSLALGVVSYVVEGLATTDYVLYSVALLAAPTGLPFPMIRSLLSCLTPAEKQGALFAGVGFVETLCSLIGSVANNMIYSATLTIMNGFVFLLLGGLMLIGACFLLLFMIVKRCYTDTPEPSFHTVVVNESGSVTSSVIG